MTSTTTVTRDTERLLHAAVACLADRAPASAAMEEAPYSALLRMALDNDELDVVYQPQVNLATGKITGVEALVRWHQQILGETSMALCAAQLKEPGLVNDIGIWALERACRDLANCTIADMEKIPVVIGLPPQQFCDTHLADRVAALLARYGIAASLLSFNITEAVLIPAAPATLSTLAQLQDMGIALGLNEFGTSLSSLTCLRQIAFRQVRIDQSYIRNLVNNPDDATVIKTMISMLHTLDIIVVAGGVDTETQCQFLRDHRCDDIQGAVFSRPVSAEVLAGLMSAGTSMPAHLLLAQKRPQTLLIVDDEINIVSALKRLLRTEAYQILSAHSGADALAILKHHAVDVILSDQRMPGMSGVEFLSIAKLRFPMTVRLVLSGFTELQSVTDAINEGAIYKFLTKPWDDNTLRAQIREAFHHQELADESRTLTRQLYSTNLELAAANQHQRALLGLKQEQIARDASSLQILHQAMRHLPMPVIAIDDINRIAFVNEAAASALQGRGPLFGGDAGQLMPEIVLPTESDLQDRSGSTPSGGTVALNGKHFVVGMHAMASGRQSCGWLVTLTPTGIGERH